jgi:hypothetical protein
MELLTVLGQLVRLARALDTAVASLVDDERLRLVASVNSCDRFGCAAARRIEHQLIDLLLEAGDEDLINAVFNGPRREAIDYAVRALYARLTEGSTR